MKKNNPIQKKLLLIYKDFLELCEGNSIDFFAEGGTKIGAEFWNGFIPWDDDIDIGMTYDNAEKLIKVVSDKGASFKYDINNGFKSKKLDVLALKFYDKESTYVSNNVITEPDSYNGFFIDIFIYIGLPDNKSKRMDYIKKITKLNDSLYRKRLFNLGESSVDQLLDEINEMSKHYDIHKSRFATIAPNASGQVFEVDKLIKTNKVNFEDTYIYSPVGAKDQIYHQYENFKKEPSEESKEKSSHESFSFIDSDTSFKYYKDKIQSDMKIKNLFSHIDKYLSSVSSEVFRISDERDSLQSENILMKNKIDTLLEKIKNIEQRNENLESERIKILKSFRWRITHPVGIIKNQIKKWSK